MESVFVKDNPLLLPLNKEKTIYDGFITVQVNECVSGMFFLLKKNDSPNCIQKSVNLNVPRYEHIFLLGKI